MTPNGYRYMNWTIDVPVLLLQMLVVLPLAATKKFDARIRTGNAATGAHLRDA